MEGDLIKNFLYGLFVYDGLFVVLRDYISHSRDEVLVPCELFPVGCSSR